MTIYRDVEILEAYSELDGTTIYSAYVHGVWFTAESKREVVDWIAENDPVIGAEDDLTY